MYDGQWQNGRKHGKGSYTWRDGEKYEGQWKGDQRNGEGNVTRVDGTREKGRWNEGARVEC